MIKRYVLLVLALSVFLFAINRLFRNNVFRSIFVDSSVSRFVAAAQPNIQWRKNSQVVARRSDFPDSTDKLSVGQRFLLKQHVGSEYECFFGIFQVDKSDDKSVLLSSLTGHVKSRLHIWADAQKRRVDWTWHSVDAQKVSLEPIQLCGDWIRPIDSTSRTLHRVEGFRVFIAGSQYSEVVADRASNSIIQFDQFRHGWWVSSKNDQSPTNLFLRHAKTGVVEKVQIVFQKSSRRNKSRPSEGKLRDLAKSFSLPGWD